MVKNQNFPDSVRRLHVPLMEKDWETLNGIESKLGTDPSSICTALLALNLKDLRKTGDHAIALLKDELDKTISKPIQVVLSPTDWPLLKSNADANGITAEEACSLLLAPLFAAVRDGEIDIFEQFQKPR